MTEIIKKLFSILSKRQKRSVAGLGVMILIGAVLETMGVSMIVPLAQAMLDAEALAGNKYVLMVQDMLGLQNMDQFVIVLLFTVVAIFVIKNVTMRLY